MWPKELRKKEPLHSPFVVTVSKGYIDFPRGLDPRNMNDKHMYEHYIMYRSRKTVQIDIQTIMGGEAYIETGREAERGRERQRGSDRQTEKERGYRETKRERGGK